MMNIALMLNQMSLLNEATYWIELQILRQFRIHEQSRTLTAHERGVFQVLLNKFNCLHQRNCPSGSEMDMFCRATLLAHHRYRKSNRYLEELFTWLESIRVIL